MGDDVEVAASTSAGPVRDRALTIGVWVLAAAVAVLLVIVIALAQQVAALGDQVTTLPRSVGSSASYDEATAQNVADLCRLLGAVAQAEGIVISDLFDDGSLGRCEQLAQEAAAAAGG